MPEDGWWEDVIEERHHWYVHDRMDSFVTGFMMGAIFVGGVIIVSSVLPWLIALVIASGLWWVAALYHQRSIIRSNSDLWHHGEDE